MLCRTRKVQVGRTPACVFQGRGERGVRSEGGPFVGRYRVRHSINLEGAEPEARPPIEPFLCHKAFHL